MAKHAHKVKHAPKAKQAPPPPPAEQPSPAQQPSNDGQKHDDGNRDVNVSPSAHQGMGAVPYEGGVAFRVWAPNADKVFVIGDFNNWSHDAHPMAHEENGYWSTDVPGAQVGNEYKYLIINGEKRLERIDPYARGVTDCDGNGIICAIEFPWEDGDFQAPPWNQMVIYEMHIGTFHRKEKDAPGNFATAIEKLPFLRDLGVTAVEVIPPMEFPGKFSWGYDLCHPYAIEAAYGGSDAFKAFVNEAHKLGIAVIMDVVYNHYGPHGLDLWQFDGWSEQEDTGGIYFYNDWRAETPWGHTRPDYGRPEVRQFIRDNVVMLLEEYHVDGLRWDGTAFIRNSAGTIGDPEKDIPEGWTLMQWINDELDERQPWKINIAEDLKNDEALVKKTSEGGAGFDSQWDTEFVYPLRKILIAPEDKHRDMNIVAECIRHRYLNDALTRVIYTESHDQVANGSARINHEILPEDSASWYGKKRTTLGAGLVFTSPGIPMLFQGQEFLEEKWFDERRPLDWNKVKVHHGVLRLYTDLIRLRRNWDDRSRGLCGQNVDVFHINNDDKVVAFHRWDQGGPRDSVVVVANFANRSYPEYIIGFPRGGLWNVRFNSDWSGYSEDFSNQTSLDLVAHHEARDGQPYSGSVGLGPYSVVILTQDE